ncbi:MAG: aspartyl-tRNA(Asn)/glutamyl-tRNA(Gln) amidotransferase subunit A [Alphaproteobacteria bacterium]|jgi:aspartyl-tRNA(Asn)/glutamyl-tRNA(Gln) amidotransferase subunit A
MSELTQLSLAELQQGLQKKQYSASEVTQAYIHNIEKNTHLNCFITNTHDLALDQAKQADEAIAKGMMKSLTGIPLGIKDLFCTKGVRTTAGSKMLENFVPDYESFVSQNLLDQGAIMLGKLNLDEFAMGSANETSYFGGVVNPWRAHNSDKDYVAGGSSGGSSAAVSAHLCVAATGTDTGGSIRQPAAFTGIVGVKPTYGRCSRRGIVAFASSLDQAGPMARNVTDASILLSVMCGHDHGDSTSVDKTVPDFTKALTGDVKGLRIGIPKEYKPEGLSPEIEDLWQKGIDILKQAGAQIIDISLPHTQYALPVYYILAPAEASSNLARYDGVRFTSRIEGDNIDDMYMKTRAEGFGEEVKRRIMIGTYVLSSGYYDAYYLQAQKVRTLIRQDFDEAYKKVDVILTPTTPSGAFAKGEPVTDPIQMYLNDVFTVTANLAGMPAMSVPAGLNSQGLPLGLQLITNLFDEETLLRTAHVLERDLGFTARPSGY